MKSAFDALGGLADTASKAVESLADTANKAGEGLAKSVNEAGEGLANSANKAGESLADSLPDASDASGLGGIADTLKSSIPTSAADSLTTAADSLAKSAGETKSLLGNSLLNKTNNLSNSEINLEPINEYNLNEVINPLITKEDILEGEGQDNKVDGSKKGVEPEQGVESEEEKKEKADPKEKEKEKEKANPEHEQEKETGTGKKANSKKEENKDVAPEGVSKAAGGKEIDNKSLIEQIIAAFFNLFSSKQEEKETQKNEASNFIDKIFGLLGAAFDLVTQVMKVVTSALSAIIPDDPQKKQGTEDQKEESKSVNGEGPGVVEDSGIEGDTKENDVEVEDLPGMKDVVSDIRSNASARGSEEKDAGFSPSAPSTPSPPSPSQGSEGGGR